MIIKGMGVWMQVMGRYSRALLLLFGKVVDAVCIVSKALG